MRVRRTFDLIVAIAALAAALASGPARADSWSLKTLYTFCSESKCADGANPQTTLIRDSSGTLFGTTKSGGGANRVGTIFEITPGGTQRVLYSFCAVAGCADGAAPQGPLLRDTSGNLYGTGYWGGANQWGTVFEVTPDGTETVLYSFCAIAGCADGSSPQGGLLMDASGNLYGTTAAGGANCESNRGCGTVFEVAPDGTETILYNFCSRPHCLDGAYPLGGLVRDTSGNLYGVTLYGGSGRGGTVFEVTPGGVETVLYNFCSTASCADGFGPSGLVLGSSGKLYGTTELGGAHDRGTVFELTPDGTERVLYSFCAAAACADGSEPYAGVIIGKSGNLYGTTWVGGSNGHGTVFELTNGGEETVLHDFCSAAKCADGERPAAGLVMDKSGNLYGTTSKVVRGGYSRVAGGGDAVYKSYGTVFELLRP